MVFDPVSSTLLGQIRKECIKENEKKRRSGYWLSCPYCGRRVVKKELAKKGCYLCGWKGTAEEIKTARARQMTQNKPPVSPTEIEDTQTYRTSCPKCRATVVTEQLLEKGCYVCGWKSEEGRLSG